MKQTLNRNTGYAVKILLEAGLMNKESNGLFLDKDCITTERCINERINYHVFNYRTFENKYLGHRKSRMTEEQLYILQDKVKELDIYNQTIPKGGNALITFIFTEIFTNYGFCVREDQVVLAIHMYQAMMNRDISMSDIPVGLGKTHAYLVAAIVYNLTYKRNLLEKINYNQSLTFDDTDPMPIVITTSSIQLQKAIEKEYIPSISKMLIENGIINEPITSVQRKGKENYICDLRLNNYVNTINTSKKPESEFQTLNQLLLGCNIDLTEVKGITNYDKRKIHVLSDKCYSCKRSSTCRFQRFMKEARESHFTFQICNHNYYLADILRRKKELKSLLPNHKAVIIDEAHKLVAAAEDMYGISISIKEIESMILQAKPHLSGYIGKSSNSIAKEALRLLESVFESLKEQFLEVDFDVHSNKYSVKITSAIKSEMNRLRLNLEMLANLQKPFKTLLIIGLKRVAKDIDNMIEANTISWIEFPNNKDDIELHTVNKLLAKNIRQDIFSKDLPFILTSGTIAVNNDFSYFSKELGLDNENGKRIIRLSQNSPFDHYQNTIRYQSKSMPYPDVKDEKYIKAIGGEIISLIEASHGHALVLFTSYTSMKKVYGILKSKHFDFPVFQLLKGKTQSINDFRKSNNGVLLACGSAWEGIDFKGDLLSHLIIVKLPFLVPDPITDEQQSQFANFDDFKKEILIPRMLIRLKQGYGRAIRAEADTAVISLLDCRANGNYKNEVSYALPECKITHNIEDIKQFILTKKNNDYFERKL